MRPRIAQELELLRRYYAGVAHAESAGEDWFHIPAFPVPSGWQVSGADLTEAPLAFLIKADYPAAAPYGFMLPAGITYGNTQPQNTGLPPSAVPFGGSWLHFSWQIENWAATDDVNRGSNLIAWCRTFVERLKEGA